MSLDPSRWRGFKHPPRIFKGVSDEWFQAALWDLSRPDVKGWKSWDGEVSGESARACSCYLKQLVQKTC